MFTRCRGVSLVELIVFIVIVGVAMAAVFAAISTITKSSADPQLRKQVLAIAESMMEEIQLMPFTYCDPDDANAATATGPGIGGSGCATTSEDTAMGTEGGETRYGTPQFDNVSDYHGFTMMAGIQDITNSPIAGLGAYKVTDITITQAGLGSGVNAIPGTEALRISITVTGPNESVTLEGYRTRYAPNSLP